MLQLRGSGFWCCFRGAFAATVELRVPLVGLFPRAVAALQRHYCLRCVAVSKNVLFRRPFAEQHRLIIHCQTAPRVSSIEMRREAPVTL